MNVAIRQLNPAQYEVRCDTTRGLFYKMQSTTSLALPFTDDGPGFTQALDSSMTRTDAPGTPQKFYRVVSGLAP